VWRLVHLRGLALGTLSDMAHLPLHLPRHLEVKESLILGAGMGLFAKRLIRKNKMYRNTFIGKPIGVYKGTRYAKKKGDSLRAEKKPYLMKGRPGEVIDGSRLDNHMRWINHSTMPNAVAVWNDDGTVEFYAIRNIEEGEEIYIDYGYDPTVRDKSLISSYISKKRTVIKEEETISYTGSEDV
jgi:SET domain-containing protein